MRYIRTIEIMGYSIAFVFFISFISWVSNIHAAKTKASTTDGESYLYNTIDSPPVLDHGISNNNFLTSTKPKIVEFYDPKWKVRVCTSVSVF